MGKISKDTSEFIKAAAMFFVVIAHYSQWYVAQADSNIILTLLTKLGRYGVAMFFAISGYGLVCSAANGLDLSYFKKRLLNVYLPYVVIQGLIRIFTGREWKAWDIGSWLTGFDAWFIFVILIFYVIFYFVWKYCAHKVTVITIGVVLVSVVLAVLVKDEIWYATNLSFVVGIWFKVYDEKIVNFLTKYGTFCCAVLGTGFAMSAVIYMMTAHGNRFVYMTFKVLAAVLWAMFILCVFDLHEPVWGIRFGINRLGKISLECYLLHRFVLNIIEKSALSTIVIVVVSLTVTLISSYIVNYIFGKIRKIIIQEKL